MIIKFNEVGQILIQHLFLNIKLKISNFIFTNFQKLKVFKENKLKYLYDLIILVAAKFTDKKFRIPSSKNVLNILNMRFF